MRIEFNLFDDRGNRYHGAAELVQQAVRQDSANGADGAAPRIPPATASSALPDHILALRQAGFFREPRTASEVHGKLQETYHCLPDRVQMALLRLQRRRELRKAVRKVGDQEKTAYVW